MSIIKEKKIRSLIQKKGFRIGSHTLKKLALKIEEHVKSSLERVIRNVIISGRKTIRGEDLS